MFHKILTYKKFKNKLKLEYQSKIDDDDTVKIYSTPYFFLEGCFYWITQDDTFVKVYKLKDFNVINFSYQMVLVKLFYHFGIAFSLEENKSVKDASFSITIPN